MRDRTQSVDEMLFPITELHPDLVTVIVFQAAYDKNIFYNLFRTSKFFFKICQDIFDKLPVYFAISNNNNIKELPIIKGGDPHETSSKKLDASIKRAAFTLSEFTLFSEEKLTDALKLQRQSEQIEKRFFGCGGVVLFNPVCHQPTLFKVRCKPIDSGTIKNSDALYFVSGYQRLEKDTYELAFCNVFKK
jgi:hypothetical protein